MSANNFHVYQGICDDCSYNPMIAEYNARLDERLLEEFGEETFKLLGTRNVTRNDEVRAIEARRPQIGQEVRLEITPKYKKMVIEIGWQDPFPFSLCLDCLLKYVKALESKEG